MLFDNGIKVVKKSNTIVAQKGARIYELAVTPVEDPALNPICRHGTVSVNVHGDLEKTLNLNVYVFGQSIDQYDIDDIVYKVMQTVDGIGTLYMIDEETRLGKRCTVRMCDEDAITTVVFSLDLKELR